ncbi:hypothetical protein CDV31_006944 [Fusarium ambrosium]|uniref:Uncharacterized protein n=1 Tax=Fusarium ambrosium TaxID=131363 RepID=A0A428U9S3_9HYPO|nr:hypothetical protein CDV31_006944 [Fusarium ambrosium]
MTLDEHDKFVKASRQTTSAISPNQPTPSPASSPPTNTSVTGINESEFPISTALFEPFSALVNPLPSSGLKTTPPDATGSETSVRVHTQKTQPHSVITFVTHTRKEVLSTASGLGGNRDVYQESKVVEDWAVATSLGATTFITPTPSELDESSLPSTPATLEIIALSSSTSILQDADNPIASSSVQPSQTQVSAAVSTRVMGT